MREENEAVIWLVGRMIILRSIGKWTPNSWAVIVTRGATSIAMEKLKPSMNAKSRAVAFGKRVSVRKCERNTSYVCEHGVINL